MANEIANHIQAAVNLVTFENGDDPTLGYGGGITSVERLAEGEYQAFLELPLAPYTAPAQFPGCAIFLTASGNVGGPPAILHPDGDRILFYTEGAEGRADFDTMINLLVIKFPQIG